MQIPSVYQPPESLGQERPNFYASTLKIVLFLSLAMSVATIVLLTFIQPEIPLFYTLSQPERQLAPKIWLFLFPALSWLITFFHFTLIKTLKDLEQNIQKMFCWTTVVIVIITALLFLRVTLLVL